MTGMMYAASQNTSAGDTMSKGVWTAPYVGAGGSRACERTSGGSGDAAQKESIDNRTRFTRCCCHQACRGRTTSAVTVPLGAYPDAEQGGVAGNTTSSKDNSATDASPALDKIRRCLKSNTYNAVASIATVVSLLAFDYTIAFLPRSTDHVTLVIVGLVFVFFSMELVLAAMSNRKYVCTFFCLLDILGAISLIPDMLELMEWDGSI